MAVFGTVPAQKQAYALLRLAIGADMFLHGATRIGAGVGNFATKMVSDFQGTVLPPDLVHAFGLTLPFVEGLIGLLLIVGWFTRSALVAGSFLMVALIFGTALRSDWNTVAIQLIYTVIYYLLLSRIGDNAYALDASSSLDRNM
jgi:thiosulfate dehydrogenase [quinone] large subunit